MRRRLSVAVIGVTTVIALAHGTTPASATHGGNSIFYSSNYSARTEFYEYGEHLYACDRSSDGMRAVAIVEWNQNGFGRVAEAQDTDGANGNCAGYQNLDIVDHTPIRLWACVRNGATGPTQFCTYVDTIA